MYRNYCISMNVGYPKSGKILTIKSHHQKTISITNNITKAVILSLLMVITARFGILLSAKYQMWPISANIFSKIRRIFIRMIFVECDNTFFPNNVWPNQHALCSIFIKNFTVSTMLRKISMLCEASLLRIVLCVPCFARFAFFVENTQQDQLFYSLFYKISQFLLEV